MLDKIGVQLYTIRDFMNTPEDVRASFKRLKSIGYDQVQTAGAKIPYDVFGQIAREEGIEIVGTHEDFNRMVNDFDEALKIQKLLDCPTMGTGGLGWLTNENIDEKIAQMNGVCQKLKPLGMKFSYHNHSHEFFRLADDRTVMDHLIDGLDQEVGTFCLDTFWVQNGGGDVRHLISRLTGRIDILHLKDMRMKTWDSPYDTVYCEIGQGNLWWEGILEEAEKAGVRSYVVELDMSDDPFKSLEISSNYLHTYFMK